VPLISNQGELGVIKKPSAGEEWVKRVTTSATETANRGLSKLPFWNERTRMVNTKNRFMPVDVNITDIFTYIAKQPRSIIAEEFRLLRINLDFAGVDRPIKRIFVTSVEPNEGKSYIAINLAIVMAQGGKKVVLLDADLRNPSIQRYLKIKSDAGLSDLLRYDLNPMDVASEWDECRECGVMVITTGITPPNPVDLITSQKMEQVLEQIDEFADVLIIDGPPMPFSDTIALSKKVDGVLLVISHAQTRRAAARKMLKQLQQVGARILGVAFNKAPYRTMSYYYYNSYHQETSSEPEPEAAN
jgi:capsular exopolysaccharide synthesis family protein